MSEPVGRIVLRNSAEHFRKHPRSWCSFGGGELETIAIRGSIERLRSALDDEEKKCCIFTMLLAQSRLVAGSRGKSAAVKDAVKILCEYHRLEHEHLDMAIKNFNDAICDSVEEAIIFIEDALHNRSMRERMKTRSLATT